MYPGYLSFRIFKGCLGRSLAYVNSRTTRQTTLPRGSFWQAKLATHDDLGNFLTRVPTFHGCHMTLMTHGGDILMTLKTNGEDTLMTPMSSGEDTVMTPVTTRDYLLASLRDFTDNPCDDIDDLNEPKILMLTIHCPHD